MKRLLLALLLLLISAQSLAKISLPKDCNEYQDVAKGDFILFNKAQLIQLGECIGKNQLKKGKINWLADSCAEVSEDMNNPMGILSLSKVEAIQIGMCLGVIDAIYTRFDDTIIERNEHYSSYQRSYRKYYCIKGNPAILRLIEVGKTPMSREEIRDKLCT